MTDRYLAMLFSPEVRMAQHAQGARPGDIGAADPQPDRLTADEAGFIAERDSFYMATTGANGWPYLQHRGGAKGFVQVLRGGELGFADLRGNRQYISLGNLAADNRVSLFFMDYVNRARLKVLGRARIVAPADAPEVMAGITDARLRTRVERVFLIDVEAYDWNCSQHITPRYTVDDLAPVVQRYEARIKDLERALAAKGEEPT